MPCDPLYTTIEAPTKLLISAIFGRFCGLEPTICGPRRISMHCDPPVHDYRDIGKTRDFGHFSPYSWAITHVSWFQEDFDSL